MAKKTGRNRANEQPWGFRQYYRLGREVVDASRQYRHQNGTRYARGVVLRFADERGIGYDLVHKARQFAEMYTEGEFQALCKLRRPDGTPLDWSQVQYLLRVRDKRVRNRFQRQAAREGWSSWQLLQAIRAEVPRRSQGGQRYKRAQSVAEALVQVESMTARWLRWARVYDEANGSASVSGGVSLEELPRGLRTSLKRTTAEIAQLQTKIQRVIEAGERPGKSGRPSRNSRTAKASS